MARVEEIGSGMVNIGKYLPFYTPGAVPEYRDGPVFTTIIPLTTEEVTGEVGKTSGITSVKRRKRYCRLWSKTILSLFPN